VQLVGTIIDARRSKGLFDLGGGKMELKAVGEVIDTPQGPVELLAVNAATATVRFDHRDVTLEIPDDKKP
jgi:hypothetical protein